MYRKAHTHALKVNCKGTAKRIRFALSEKP